MKFTKIFIVFYFFVLFSTSGCITIKTDTPTLLRYIEDENAGIRCLGAKFLGIKKEKRAVPHLIFLLLNDSSPDVRYMAAFSLGEIGDFQSLSALEKALTDEGKYWEEDSQGRKKVRIVKESAAEAIIRIQGKVTK